MSTLTTIQNAVGVTADGIWGPKTQAAVAAKMGVKNDAKVIQNTVGVKADGIVGPKTIAAIAAKMGVPVKAIPTQAAVRKGTSVYGKAGDESNLMVLVPPYQLYFEGTEVKTIRVHREAAADLLAALREVLVHYGAAQIHRLGLDLYSGCYAYRKTRSGASMSMHAWGVAVDFDAEHNQMAWGKPRARFSGDEYRAFIDIMERHNFISMGRHSDRDWMHFQRATF